MHTFIDKPYNRTGFTLVSPVPQEVRVASLVNKKIVLQSSI